LANLESPILWRGTDNDSFEFFRLKETPDGHWLSGTVLTRLEGKPAKIDYLIKCDEGWHTREVAVVQDWNAVQSRTTRKIQVSRKRIITASFRLLCEMCRTDRFWTRVRPSALPIRPNRQRRCGPSSGREYPRVHRPDE
jgi:hypothetical protein